MSGEAISQREAVARAVFLAGLPTGAKGDLIPGHTTWDDLGAKAKERYLDMADAAIEETTMYQERGNCWCGLEAEYIDNGNSSGWYCPTHGYQDVIYQQEASET